MKIDAVMRRQLAALVCAGFALGTATVSAESGRLEPRSATVDSANAPLRPSATVQRALGSTAQSRLLIPAVLVGRARFKSPLAAVGAPPAPKCDTGIVVQNLDSSNDATIDLTFYENSPANANPIVLTQTVLADGTSTFDARQIVPGNSFTGSAGIESTTEIAAFASYACKQGGQDVFGSIPGTSMAQPSSSSYVTTVLEGLTTVCILNGLLTTATAGVAFFDENGSPEADRIVDLGAFGNACVKSPRTATYAQVFSSGSVAAVVNQVGNGSVNSTAYTGFVDAPPKVFLPTVMLDHFGFNTSVDIQNVGNGPVDVTVEFTPSGGAGPVAKAQLEFIAPGQFRTLEASEVSGMPASFLGSATVSATGGNGNLLAVANLGNETTAATLSYNAVSEAGAVPRRGTSTFFIPNALRTNETSISLQNPRGKPSKIRLSCNGEGGSFRKNVTLAGDATEIVELPHRVTGDELTCNIVVKKGAAIPVVMVVGQDSRTINVYEGFDH